MEQISERQIKQIKHLIRLIILEEKSRILGEPDSTPEKFRDNPQPQYEEEEENTNDEASTVGGMGSGLGPNMPLQYDPEKPVYDPYRRKKKK
tara:strand:- start:1986 stop:2261 length:276 start_codon:yes stop_codon:yes gene_type:complete